VPAKQPPRPSWQELLASRERQPKKPHASQGGSLPKLPATEESIQINVNKPAPETRSFGPPVAHSSPESEFVDREHWDHVPPTPMVETAPAELMSEPVVRDNDEFSAKASANVVPISLRPHLKLSMIERFGLLVLLVLLLAGSAAILGFFLNRLPTEAQRAKANDFPIKGDLLTIQSATSYWRAPVMEGSTIDTFRRGTQLLPVLELTASGGPAAIRVLFRNEDHAVVGDAVTRTFRGENPLKIPATAGFDDLGMHAAYRTGESKPWTIEVLEAPTENAAGTSFKKLFEMNISTDRH
jgi:hypothetical protein